MPPKWKVPIRRAGFGERYLIDLIVAVPFTFGDPGSGLKKWWFGGAYLAVVAGWLALFAVLPARDAAASAATAFACLPGFFVCGRTGEPNLEKQKPEKVLEFVSEEIPVTTGV